MAANDDLRDSAIRHAAYLAKYGEGLADKIVAILNSADKDLAAKLAKGLNTDLTEKRFQELLAEIRILNNTVYGGAFETLEEELQKVAEVSAEYEADALSKAVPITSYRASLPSPNKLAKIAATSPIDGYLLKSWTDNMSANRTARVEKTLRIGMINGETIDQLTRRVMGTKAKGYKDGVLNVSRNSARSLAITANATIAARARKETHLANTDIIKQVMWLATLDTRTSPICQSRDGQTWKVDEKHPETPAHIRCRSLLVPVTKSYDELGIAKKEITKGDRASMDGQVPAKTTYGDWLAKQSEERQDSILGKQRADLFRSGNLPFKEMYRTDGSYKTVEELRSALGMSATKPEKRAEKAPESPQAGFSPINPRVTDESIKVIPRKQAKKDLEAMLAVGARDPRHEEINEFRDTKGAKWGEAKFPPALSDEAASMLTAIHPELDAMADRFGVARLRAYRSVSGARIMGNMGDASMGVNPTYFNAFAAKVGGGNADDVIASLVKQRDGVRAELEDIRVTIGALKEDVFKIDRNSPDWLDAYDKYRAASKEYDKKVRKFNELSKKAGATARKGGDTAATWKVGDDVEKRPFNAADYFTGIDRARNVLYHEFAHHVHQTWKKDQRRSRGYTPPLENELRGIWLNKFYGVKPEFREKRDRQASKYATTNEKEWFAENFSLVMMGRNDLADPDAVEIIERLLNERG